MQFDPIHAVTRNLPLPVIVLDAAERVQVVNDAARDLIGAGLEGRHYVTVLRQPSVSGAIDAAYRTSAPQRGRHVVSAAAGEISFDVRVQPFYLQEEGALVLSFEDTTPIETARAMRRDFVANVSHELRSPLTAVLGFIETLKGPARDDPTARARFLDVMEHEARRMNRLIRDLLSLSRVEGDARRRPRDKVELQDVLRLTLSALEPSAQEHDVTFQIDASDGPLTVMGDSDQLTQVFQNLVENAIKYGGDGATVTLRVVPVERDRILRRRVLRVDVIDQGAGIEAVHLPRLTERFYRIDDHRSREKGGTGLGLAIVKHIISRHRGRLKIDSEPGRGTSFSVFLPME